MQPGERDTRLIDWERARTIAINMNRGNALTTVERARLDAYYRGIGRTLCSGRRRVHWHRIARLGRADVSPSTGSTGSMPISSPFRGSSRR